MRLTNADIVELVEWRRVLHRKPELSGEEKETAATVVEFLKASRPDRIVTGLGGHGVAAIYEGAQPGPTVMFRAELDGLPIDEITDIPHRSEVAGRGHMCGHDGHMTILAALGRGLGRQRPQRGRAILLFQPAEENGAGAAAVIADAQFPLIAPDYAFALHNMPGLPLGHVRLSPGPANCASRGLRIVLAGKTAHASTPENGVSPMAAVSQLMPALTALGRGGSLSEDYALATVTHAAMGEPAFGVAPGRAEVWTTLRTLLDSKMAGLCAQAEEIAARVAQEGGLRLEMSYHDVFHHCDNNEEAVAILREALDAEAVPHQPGEPSRGSEDFGLFGRQAKSAMFILGSGEASAKLHNPDFDFPDALIETGARVFMRTARNMLG